ncbi:developmental and secondary metabolism regulator veA [Colletotrichum spaethianum]|uniref:Developmental and secondary metabolism regulator veA n=1 Tax=Colletotrichum spaethianum TaxID=700344 RepID=A0AA37PBS5_9PEZI|nr:developmental and secondary metabolism regulator veA [Colletotrichum spaethianum]GKT49355.1 developmental and secondary metabolism regulator veA [Colletotrichum spaethianum]
MTPIVEHRPPVDTIGESETFTDRPTRNGSRMFYELKVLQQPERARACGSGQKSAADRRPVDPPPVVQLHVYEGPTREEARDVTFNYRANFFLYAELCPARPMAHGRVNTPAATSAPVLTGMPVSGMAYLDRPTEAGYFLFPDLSVRHEGRYVLAFHLYEDIKQEEDRDPDGDAADEALNPAFMYRLAVKSVPFNVFSAKKFPGLTESTNLSKTISEQGCRVRIRRDVRMRRRDGKPAGNEFESNPENEYRNSRRTQTPEIRSNADQFRARSSSNSSEHRAAYPPAPERRPSAVESFQAPPPPPPPPMAYGPAPSTNVHLRFGSDASSAPYPPHQYAQPSAQPPPISPTTASYQSSQPSPYHPTSTYSYASRPSSQYAASNPPPTPRDVYDRRPSAMAVPPSPSIYGSAPAPKDIDMARRESDYRRDSLPPRQLAPVSDAPPQMGTKLPPMLPSIERLTAVPSHLTSRTDYIEAAPPSVYNQPPETARAGAKRVYGETFAEDTRPLFDRQRQQDAHHGALYTTRYSTADSMEYKRADGSCKLRQNNSYLP